MGEEKTIKGHKTIAVIPTYNEADNIRPLITALLSLGIDGLEVLVIDDNSPDGTGKIAEELSKTYPGRIHVLHRQGKQGLGTAYVLGFRWALEHGADYAIEMDADFSHDPSYVPTFLERLRDYDIVVGSRYVPGGRIDERWSFWRRFLSWGGNIYARLITGLRVSDTTAGFKCFRRQALEALPLDKIKSDGYAFQIEMAYLSQKLGHRVLEVPITFLERNKGVSKMSWRIVMEAILRVWMIRFFADYRRRDY